MEVLTASVGFCLGITRAYREMSKRALAEAPFAVAHQNAGGEFDTLSRIARRVELLDDLICPFIEKLDRVVGRLAKEGFDIAIVGTKDNHHCRVAKKVADEHGRRCYVIERADDVDVLPNEKGRRIALVGQVTGNTEIFTEVIERIRSSKAPIK